MPDAALLDQRPESTPAAPPEDEGFPTTVAAGRIRPDPRNPRKFFDPEELKELTDSIREKGVLQRILIRPYADSYMIVFGERRWRAFTSAFGAEAEMPVTIRDMSDEEALEAQIAENEARADPSETEQGDAAKRTLEACGGDRAEAIRRLGWPASKFDRRIALTALNEVAKTALNERRIKVGHAELLAAVPADKQEKALQRIFDFNLDVAKTRELLERMTHELAGAPFDRAECAKCPYNSSLQGALFETAVASGHCTNPACYDLKLAEHERKAAEARASGLARAPAATPGNHVSEASTLLVSTSTAPTGADKTTSEGEQEDSSSTEGEALSAGPAEAAASAPKKNAGAATSSAAPARDPDTLRTAIRARARQMRETAWRHAVARFVAEAPDKARAIIIAAAFDGTLREISHATLPKRADAILGKGFAATRLSVKLAAAEAFDNAKTDAALGAIAAAYALDVSNYSNVEAAAAFAAVDLRKTWTVNKAFLDLYTKEDLKFIGVEAGLCEHLGAKSFAKLVNGKRDALIAGMLAAKDFSWAGRLPSAMTLSGRFEGPITA